MSCCICMLNNSNTNLGCNHSFCYDCISNWRQRNNTCPICRQIIRYRESDYLMSLGDKIKYTGITEYSQKGTSKELTLNETNILKNIFGNFIRFSKENLIIGDKILFQKYRDNCWFYGKIINLDNLEIDDSVFICRNSGKIFKTSPFNHKLIKDANDKIFKIL